MGHDEINQETYCAFNNIYHFNYLQFKFKLVKLAIKIHRLQINNP